MKRIGILTGGGDAPGLNAAIRAVVKTALGVYGMEVFGIRRGYEGLLAEGGVFPLTYETVSGILPRGGSPTPYDRWLASQFGVVAARLAAEGRSGRMVALRQGSITDVDLVETQGHARQVDVNDVGVQTARSLGICLGDRYEPQHELEE